MDCARDIIVFLLEEKNEAGTGCEIGPVRCYIPGRVEVFREFNYQKQLIQPAGVIHPGHCSLGSKITYRKLNGLNIGCCKWCGLILLSNLFIYLKIEKVFSGILTGTRQIGREDRSRAKILAPGSHSYAHCLNADPGATQFL
jgi:hypothetical protein